jgi:hypothetical protein
MKFQAEVQNDSVHKRFPWAQVCRFDTKSQKSKIVVLRGQEHAFYKQSHSKANLTRKNYGQAQENPKKKNWMDSKEFPLKSTKWSQLHYSQTLFGSVGNFI